MLEKVDEYENIANEDSNFVEIPKGDWTGESLKHGLVNSYIYFDVFKNLTNGKPIKIIWAGVSLAFVFSSIFIASLAYQLTSTVSAVKGFLSATLVVITMLWLAWLNVKPSSDTTMLVDSVRTFFYLISHKPTLRDLMFRGTVEGNRIIFDKGKRIAEVYIVEGVVNKTMLARDLVSIFTELENLLPNIGDLTMIQSSQIERVEFSELKRHYRVIRNSKDSSRLQKKMAQIYNRRAIDTLTDELTQKEVVFFVANKEDELQKGRTFLRYASDKGVIANYQPIMEERLKRMLDRL